ncbi:hypothetical protein [Niallia sp. BSM11]|uniref:hypothetical protein n=1 Tax=Niallia sp. BSM11 TaxID=3391576 RepID=UPI003984C4B0
MNKIPEIRNNFLSFLSNHPQAKEFVFYLEQNADLILFGGCIRDYMEHRFTEPPRDFDIVLNNNNLDLETLIYSSLGSLDYSICKNKFGGYKIHISDLKFDIWEIQKTWAFQEKKVSYSSFEDLNKTVFLNIDSLFYNLSTGILYDEGYREALTRSELDIILQENPYPELNLARAFRFKSKYGLDFSSKLKDFFYSWLGNFESDKTALNILKEIEIKRYNSSLVEDEWETIKNNNYTTSKELVELF